MSILVIGSVNIDYGIHCDKMPSLGETIRGNSFSKTLGGKGLNQAVAAFKYDPSVQFVGSIGTDVDAQLVVDAMDELGISKRYLQRHESVNTGLAMILRAEGDNVIVINEGANGALDIDETCKAIDTSEATSVILQLELPYHTTREILAYCKHRGIRTVLNTAPALLLDQNDYALIDVLILNQTETHFYTEVFPVDEVSASQAAATILSKGVREVVITLGSKGSFFSDGKQHYFQKAFHSNVVDSTGAGDAFVGVFVCAYESYGSVARALEEASAAGSLTCEKVGAVSASPTREAIMHRIMEEK